MNFDNKDLYNPNNPAYLEDAPKEIEMHQCGLCEDYFEQELDTWVTTLGACKVCAYCTEYNLQNETHILIEFVK